MAMRLLFWGMCWTLLAAAVSGSYFYQNVCATSRCSDCVESSLPQGVCVLTTNGGSAVNYCSTYDLLQDIYIFSTNCSMYGYSQKAPLDTCMNGDTSYVEYACPSGMTVSKGEVSKLLSLTLPVLTPIAGLCDGLLHQSIKGEAVGIHLLRRFCRGQNERSKLPLRYFFDKLVSVVHRQDHMDISVKGLTSNLQAKLLNMAVFAQNKLEIVHVSKDNIVSLLRLPLSEIISTKQDSDSFT